MKKSFFLFVALLLCIFLIGCSPLDLLLGPSGSIGVTTYPSGAKIFLNNNDTGYFTPHTFTNLIKGSYKITVTLDDISYTEIVKVYSNCPTDLYKDLLPRLKKIIIDPDFLYTEIGETRDFSKITAYYYDINYYPVDIELSDCNYTKDNNHAIINSGEGSFTGISKGQTTVTLSYTEREFTKTDIVDIFIATYPTPEPTPEPSPEPELSGNIEILDWHNRLSDPPLYYYVEGTLKNIGDKTADFVKVTIKALDINDELVSIDYGYANPYTILPNQEATFQVMVENKSEIEKFAITINWE